MTVGTTVTAESSFFPPHALIRGDAKG
jgi:hypothetical protein